MNESWLQCLVRRPQARIRLFCFPYAGASAAVYRQWGADLPADIELCAVELPGHGARLREPALRSIPAIVEGVVTAIRPLLERPYALFGHSMGATLAYEVARALAAGGAPVPQLLAVSGRRPPWLADPATPLRHLSDAGFVAEVDRRYGGIPAAIRNEPDVLALLLPSLRADIAALETHAVVAPAAFEFPVAAFGGNADPVTPAAHLEAWRGAAGAGFSVRTFSGGHFYLDAWRGELLAVLRGLLDHDAGPAGVAAAAGAAATTTGAAGAAAQAAAARTVDVLP